MAAALQARGSSTSKIISSLRQISQLSSASVHVHLTRQWIERDPFQRATQLFYFYRLQEAPKQNSVLIYVNLKRRKFAIYADAGVHSLLGNRYWFELGKMFKDDLLSTYFENAISLLIKTLAITLHEHYPPIECGNDS